MRIAAGLIVPALAAGLFFVPMADMADAGGRKGGAHAKAGGGMKGMRAGGMRMRGAHMRGMRKGGRSCHARCAQRRPCHAHAHAQGGGHAMRGMARKMMRRGGGSGMAGHGGAAGGQSYNQRRQQAIRQFRQMRRETVRELRQAGVSRITPQMEHQFRANALNRLQGSLGVTFTQREIGELNRRVGRAVARFNDGGFRGRDGRVAVVAWAVVAGMVSSVVVAVAAGTPAVAVASTTAT
jgi:hypothetical protein